MGFSLFEEARLVSEAQGLNIEWYTKAEAAIHEWTSEGIFSSLKAHNLKVHMLGDLGFPSALAVKNLPSMQETWVQSLDREDPLKEVMAAHANILAWRISWTDEPGGLQSVGSQRVRHD